MPKISFKDLECEMDSTKHGDMTGKGLGKLSSNIERLMKKKQRQNY